MACLTVLDMIPCVCLFISKSSLYAEVSSFPGSVFNSDARTHLQTRRFLAIVLVGFGGGDVCLCGRVCVITIRHAFEAHIISRFTFDFITCVSFVRCSKSIIMAKGL
uniref:Secreted protein n=1 Tax=Mesocestoides corti TaxID=53468 RepID=A0A5K3F6S9_MESCO